MKAICTLPVSVALLFTLATPSSAQDRGQFGLSFKAQLYPQFGLVWIATERLSLRASGYAMGSGEFALDVSDSFIVSVSGLYRRLLDDPRLSLHVGPDVTYNGFSERTYVGGLFGSQYLLSDRFGAFGEVGISFGIGEGSDMQMFNTGVGVLFFFN